MSNAVLQIADYAHVKLKNVSKFEGVKGVILEMDFRDNKTAVELENGTCIGVANNKLEPIDPCGKHGIVVCKKSHKMQRINYQNGPDVECRSCEKGPIKRIGDWFYCQECKKGLCIECGMEAKLNACGSCKKPLIIIRDRKELKTFDKKYGGGYECGICHVRKYQYPMWHCPGDDDVYGKCDWNACTECIPEKTHGFKETFKYPRDINHKDEPEEPEPPQQSNSGRGAPPQQSGRGAGRGDPSGGLGGIGREGMEELMNNPAQIRALLKSMPGYEQLASHPQLSAMIDDDEGCRQILRMVMEQGNERQGGGAPGGGPGGMGGMPGMGRGPMGGMGRGGMGPGRADDEGDID